VGELVQSALGERARRQEAGGRGEEASELQLHAGGVTRDRDMRRDAEGAEPRTDRPGRGLWVTL